MRSVSLLILLLCIAFSCSEKEQNKKKETADLALSYQYDSLELVYPSHWLLTENIDELGSNLISIKPKDSLSSGVISIAVFKAELPILKTLLSMKGSVYLSLDIPIDAIDEGEAKEITYQKTDAVYQTYQADLGTAKVSGQFIVLNKSGRCYVLFFQTKEGDKKANDQVFDLFEKRLKVR